MKRIIKWLRESNETLGAVLLIIIIWYLIPPLLRIIDPKAGQFGVEVIYVAFIAVMYCLIGLLFIWVYLRIAFPKGRKLLDDLFEDSKLTAWQKSQLILRLFGWLVVLYAVSLLSVTGISAIM
jgi:Na+/melibiose symporter-like transporter